MAKSSQISDSEVVILAKHLLHDYSRSHMLLKSVERELGKRAGLKRSGRWLRFARCGKKSGTLSEGNRNLEELFSIIASGIENGTDIRRALNLFIARLEQDMGTRNRIREKIGSSQMLTTLGMGAFFPLFSGISVTIITSALGLFEQSTAILCRNFLLVAIVYVPMILYISSAFAHPEKSAKLNAIAIAPCFLLAVSILFLTQTYLGNIL